MTGIFSGRQLFGSTTLEGYNSYDTFLMHVTALGAIDWAIQGNMSDSFGRSLTHDGAGGALVTGCFSGSSAPGISSARAYVMHVMRSGVIDWVAVAGGTSFDNAYFTAGTSNLAQGTGIVSDGAGGALVTGWFSGVASFGSTSLESRGDLDVFVMHVTASGAIDWAVQAGGTSFDQSNGIAHSRRQSQLLRRGLHDRPVREGGHRSSRHRSSHASDPRVHSRYETRPWAYWRVDADPEPDALTALLEVQEQFGRCRVHHDVHHRPRDNELPDECHAAVTQLLDFGVERGDLFQAIELNCSELGLAPLSRLLPVLECAST